MELVATRQSETLLLAASQIKLASVSKARKLKAELQHKEHKLPSSSCTRQLSGSFAFLQGWRAEERGRLSPAEEQESRRRPVGNLVCNRSVGSGKRWSRRRALCHPTASASHLPYEKNPDLK